MSKSITGNLTPCCSNFISMMTESLGYKCAAIIDHEISIDEAMVSGRCSNNRQSKNGKGLVNKIINKLPFELHAPGYQYCGPGTKLQARLARGDPGINPLDAACKEHDIAYSKNPEDVAARNRADKVLAERAWKRVLAGDAHLGEKAIAWGVTNTMKIKSKLGAGLSKLDSCEKQTNCKSHRCNMFDNKPKLKVGADKRRRVKNKKIKKSLKSLRQIVNSIKSTPSANSVSPIKSALIAARKAVRDAGGMRKIKIPRILPVSAKIGGILPFLIPLFAGLSATGALAGGVAGITKAINNAKDAKRQLEESRRHNATMEAIALGKGLYLKPYKTGLGLYLNDSKN